MQWIPSSFAYYTYNQWFVNFVKMFNFFEKKKSTTPTWYISNFQQSIISILGIPCILNSLKSSIKYPKLKASNPVLAELGMKSIVKVNTICKKTREGQIIFSPKMVLIWVPPRKFRICLPTHLHLLVILFIKSCYVKIKFYKYCGSIYNFIKWYPFHLLCYYIQIMDETWITWSS